MAEKPAPPPAEDGHTFTYKVILLIFLLMIVGGISAGWGIDSYLVNRGRGLEAEAPEFNVFSLAGKGTIELGKEIVAIKKLEVRTDPGGALLGLQDRGSLAKIMEGPVQVGNVKWWRLDFENAPDGWVKDEGISANLLQYNLINFFPWIFSGLRSILILIGIIAFVLILIVSSKRKALYKMIEEREKLKNSQGKVVAPSASNGEESKESALPIPGLPIGPAPMTEDVSNRKWKNVKSLLQTHNLSDWRQAIMEADIMLDEMLDRMGYHGDSLGEKLKQIEPSDFLTLNQAWEAHKIRNQVAHRGSSYVLGKEEAERVIGLYEEVFKEFYYI